MVEARLIGGEMTTAVVTPERSLAQRLEALERANTIRMGRAQLKRDIQDPQAVINVLLAPPPFAETMKVYALMMAIPHWGRIKVNKALGAARIAHGKTVTGLSERQRRDLIRILRGAK